MSRDDAGRDDHDCNDTSDNDPRDDLTSPLFGPDPFERDGWAWSLSPLAMADLYTHGGYRTRRMLDAYLDVQRTRQTRELQERLHPRPVDLPAYHDGAGFAPGDVGWRDFPSW